MIDKLTDNSKKILIVGPHPDDVEFSTGRLILKRKGKNTHVICMTDGRKGQEGTSSKKTLNEDDYAVLREKESKRALKELNIANENQFFLKLPDQQLILKPFIIDKLYLLLKRINPDFVLIPPWEGAHPDHDTAHLFMIVACQNLNFEKSRILEYGSYNNLNGKFSVQKFIPSIESEEKLIPTPNEQKRWLSIMKIFRSQKNQQKHYIPLSHQEIFRKLPKYDYSKLPYSTKQSEIIRDLLKPIYPLARSLIPSKDKMFYETWKTDTNPNEIKQKLNHYVKHYGVK